MREARQRSEAVLDDVSADLGEVLRHADALLAEWSAFGASVKVQVEREAKAIGAAVASSVDGAVARAVAAGVDRAVPEQLTARMASLTAELTKLEHRARTAARAISDERTHDRRLLGVLVLGVLVANALLVVLLLLQPRVAAAPAPEATRIEIDPLTTSSEAPSIMPSTAAADAGGVDPNASDSARPNTSAPAAARATSAPPSAEPTRPSTAAPATAPAASTRKAPHSSPGTTNAREKPAAKPMLPPRRD